MKTLKLFAVVLMAMCLASCGGDPNSVTLKVEPQLGELGNYISIDDQEIVVTLSDEAKDSTDVKTIASSLAFTVNKSFRTNHGYGSDLKVKVLDKNHNEICALPCFSVELKSDYGRELDFYLPTGPNRAQMKDEDKNWEAEDQEMWDKICSEGVYVIIEMYDPDGKFAENNADASSASQSDDTSMDSADFDATLDSYEEFIDQYVVMLKKAENGDMSALSEYPALLEKAQEVGNQLESTKGNMSSEQLSRYAEITAKMANIAKS